MKFLIFLTLFSVLSYAQVNDYAWVDLNPEELEEFEVKSALNWGAQNLTKDAINKDLIPQGSYQIVTIESAQKPEGGPLDVDIDDDDENNDDDGDGQDWYNRYRFIVEIRDGERSGLKGNYTVNVDGDTLDGQTVYSFYMERYTYTWFTSLVEAEFDTEAEFEWTYENEWNEFTEIGEALTLHSGVESAGDASDEPDDLVLVVQEDGSTSWELDDNIFPPINIE